MSSFLHNNKKLSFSAGQYWMCLKTVHPYKQFKIGNIYRVEKALPGLILLVDAYAENKDFPHAASAFLTEHMIRTRFKFYAEDYEEFAAKAFHTQLPPHPSTLPKAKVKQQPSPFQKAKMYEKPWKGMDSKKLGPKDMKVKAKKVMMESKLNVSFVEVFKDSLKRGDFFLDKNGTLCMIVGYYKYTKVWGKDRGGVLELSAGKVPLKVQKVEYLGDM